MLRHLLLATLTVSTPATPRPVAGSGNPLLAEWRTPFGVPPWREIQLEHFRPAIEEAMAAERREVDAIVAQREPATFSNTIEALDGSGSLLRRVSAVLANLASADTNERIQAINRDVTGLLTAHRDAITLNDALFRRVHAAWAARESLALDPDQRMLLERTYRRFVRSGAELDSARKARLREVNSELAALGVRFSDNVLAETNAYRLVLDRPEQLAGLPADTVSAAADAARRAGSPGRWVFTLDAPSLWPFLQYAADRELRRQIFTAYTTRCDHGGPTDNKAVLARIAALRTEKARLFGFATWADYVLDDNMASTPAQVYGLLERIWVPAKAAAAEDAAALEAALRADGETGPLQPWDWFFYTERIRKARYDLDDSELRPYFPLDRVRQGAFWLAHQLYGITFTERKDIPVYHAEVRAYEVKDADGSHLAIFLTDDHPRPGKRAGAWASGWREQYVRDGRDVRPLIVNVCNFSRPSGNAPALLSLEEARTLFHEFGHALHAMLSRKRYESLGEVPRDFVELPSQVMENWVTEPEVLVQFAHHWKSGAVIPSALVRRIEDARHFDQGFANVEYIAASLLDLEWHTQVIPAEADAAQVERIALARMGMPAYIVPRYRSTYFQHVFGPGNGYSAGYYGYLWARVLDADAFAAFKERGLFDHATAEAFRRNILEKGRSEDPMALYARFRGRAPSVTPLLERLGFGAR